MRILNGMATAVSTTPLAQAPITSAQPGGGTIVRLELAWGRVRRAWLRRCRPAYVREMLARRQGECPDCPHDVIDPRDLKFYRNVCGHWFKDEDDRFAWRGRIGLARLGLCEVVCCSVVFLVICLALLPPALAGYWLCWLLWAPAGLVYALVVYFFRDPERAVPAGADALVSPADGTITDIGEVNEPEFGRALRIGMFLSILNVHVNRAPRSGKVTSLRYFPGGFLDARHPEANTLNEQLWIDLEDAVTGKPLRVKQISGKIARRIVCWLKPGEEVQAGARIGMIKFGSRTEVFLPLDVAVEPAVKVGDTVKGGSSVLLRFK